VAIGSSKVVAGDLEQDEVDLLAIGEPDDPPIVAARFKHLRMRALD
jgi:hypothetical protein